ncbi:MAG: hypothetical protein ACE37D_00835 [Pseudomonadales bacterium]
MTRLLLSFITIIFLTACGTESEDETATSPESNVTAAAPASTATSDVSNSPPAQSDAISKTADLKASTTFDFTSSFDVGVDINLDNKEKLYLNICNRFDTDDGKTNVDYDSCVLQAPIENGRYQGTLSLTNDVQQLVIAIWNYSGSDPTYYFWDLSVDGPEIRI